MIDKSAARDGSDTWTCCLCQSLKTKFLAGIKAHIQFVHCRKIITQPEMSRDSNVLHERNPIWIESMLVDSRVLGDPPKWTCCICLAYDCSYVRGMRSHIIRAHCIQPQKETVEDEERHDNDPEWIEEIMEKSESVTGAYTWTCCLCGEFKTKHSNGIRYHIIKMHCKKGSEESLDKPVAEKFVRDPEWLKAMVEKSKRDDNWTCCICNKFTTETHVGIRIHINRVHCFDRQDSISDEEDDDESVVNFNETLEQGIKNELIKSMIVKPAVKDANGPALACSLCDATSTSFQQMRRHVERIHRQVLTTAAREKIEETYESIDADEIENLIGKCRKSMVTLNGTHDIWVCQDCDDTVFYSHKDIHHHISVDHMGINPSAKQSSSKPRLSCESDDDTEWLPSHKEIETANFENVIESEKENEEACGEGVQKENGDNTQDDNEAPKTSEIQDKPNDEPTDEPYTPMEIPLDKFLPPAPAKPQAEDDEVIGKYLLINEMTADEKRWLRQGIRRSKVSSKLWKCFICKELVKRNAALRYHLLVYHIQYLRLGPEKYNQHREKCKSTPHQPRSRSHPSRKKLRIKYNCKPKPTRCNSCDLAFATRRQFLAHKRIHLLTNPIVTALTLHKCESCSFNFRNKEDLGYHENSQHVLIPAAGFSMTKIKLEKLSHHEDSTWTFGCGHCGQKYETEMDMKRHIMFKHQKLLSCPLDDQIFCRLNDFFTHITVEHLIDANHTEEMTYTCDHCGKKFIDKDDLAEHLLEVFCKETSQCDLCGDFFNSAADLTEHQLGHDVKVSCRL